MPTLPIELRVAPWRDRAGRISGLKSVTLLALFYPAGWMIYHWQFVWLLHKEFLTYWSGVWALVVLLVALSVTPLRYIFDWPRLISIRRMLGVAALFYTVVHIVVYFWLRNWESAYILNEILTRLTLIVASLSAIGLAVLGATSFDGVVRRMGAMAWHRLHRMTYTFTGLAVLHFLLSPGALGGLPFLMAGVFTWLMVWRVLKRRHLGESVPALLYLGVGTVLFTVALEAIWPALLLDGNPMFVLGLNFSLLVGVSPGWKMLVLSAAIAAGAAWRHYPRKGVPA